MKLNYDEFRDELESSNNIRGLEPGDTIIIPYNGIDTEFVVLGKNINPNIGEEDKYDFIDIMSKELLIPVGTKWKEIITGISLNFADSDIINELHSRLELFPKEIQNKVVPKKAKFLTGFDPTNIPQRVYTIINMGKVWIPSIKEVTDECRRSDADPNSQQYPYFKDKKKWKLKKGDNWWTCSSGAFLNHLVERIGCLYYDGDHFYGRADISGCGSHLCLRIRIN